MSYIRREPEPQELRDPRTFDELRELVRDLWSRVTRIEDELAGREDDRSSQTRSEASS